MRFRPVFVFCTVRFRWLAAGLLLLTLRGVGQATQATAPLDAVLMAVRMPELDGYAATRALREFFPDERQLPIIGLTASALPEDRGIALAAGMNDTLAKPFDPTLLPGSPTSLAASSLLKTIRQCSNPT